MSLPRIVVVGGGAGGLELVTRLGRKLGKRQRAEIVLQRQIAEQQPGDALGSLRLGRQRRPDGQHRG